MAANRSDTSTPSTPSPLQEINSIYRVLEAKLENVQNVEDRKLLYKELAKRLLMKSGSQEYTSDHDGDEWPFILYTLTYYKTSQERMNRLAIMYPAGKWLEKLLAHASDANPAVVRLVSLIELFNDNERVKVLNSLKSIDGHGVHQIVQSAPQFMRLLQSLPFNVWPDFFTIFSPSIATWFPSDKYLSIFLAHHAVPEAHQQAIFTICKSLPTVHSIELLLKTLQLLASTREPLIYCYLGDQKPLRIKFYEALAPVCAEWKIVNPQFNAICSYIGFEETRILLKKPLSCYIDTIEDYQNLLEYAFLQEIEMEAILKQLAEENWFDNRLTTVKVFKGIYDSLLYDSARKNFLIAAKSYLQQIANQFDSLSEIVQHLAQFHHELIVLMELAQKIVPSIDDVEHLKKFLKLMNKPSIQYFLEFEKAGLREKFKNEESELKTVYAYNGVEWDAPKPQQTLQVTSITNQTLSSQGWFSWIPFVGGNQARTQASPAPLHVGSSTASLTANPTASTTVSPAVSSTAPVNNNTQPSTVVEESIDLTDTVSTTLPQGELQINTTSTTSPNKSS